MSSTLVVGPQETVPVPFVTHWTSHHSQQLPPNHSYPSSPASVVYIPLQHIVSPIATPSIRSFFFPPSPAAATPLSPSPSSSSYCPLMVAGHHTVMAQDWRHQMVDTRVSDGMCRGSGFGPARGAFRFSGRRPGRDSSWWDRDYDDGKPRNPWKKVEASGSTVAVGNVEDWPTVGRGDKRSAVGVRGAEPAIASGNWEQEEMQQKSAVGKKERMPGVLHLPLHSLQSASVVEGKPYSYSEALMKESTTASAKDADDEADGEVYVEESEEAKKKKKKKKDAADTQEKQEAVKKSKQKISFDFGNILEQLETVGQQSAPRKMAVGVGITAAVQHPPPPRPAMSHGVVVPRNVLDASAPLRQRGKEREVPKAKKPSSLKKIILKEREEKRVNREMPVETEEMLKMKMRRLHSRRFRDYCDQVLDKQLDDLVMKFLQKLIQFQDKQYHKDPVKAKTKRRIVLGLREVHKHLKLEKLKCVIVSPNVESITSQGGIDDLLQQIRAKCEEQNVPIVFALSRRGLGRAVSKKVPVSIVGVFNYDGAQDQYNELLSVVEDARRAYTKLVAEFEGETRRLEEAARSGMSSSSGESSAVSSRKTSKTDSETDSVRSDRKISGTSDDGDWMPGLSQLSVAAPEFHPVAYQAVPPPWPPYHLSQYEYPLTNQMMPMAAPQYFVPHPHSYVASPPHVQYDGFQLGSPSHQFQGPFVAWRDHRDETQGMSSRLVPSSLDNGSVQESKHGAEGEEEFVDEGAVLSHDGDDIEEQEDILVEEQENALVQEQEDTFVEEQDVLVDSDGVVDEEDEEEIERPVGDLQTDREGCEGKEKVGDGKQEDGMTVGGEGTVHAEQQVLQASADERKELDNESPVRFEGNGEDARTFLSSNKVGTEETQ